MGKLLYLYYEELEEKVWNYVRRKMIFKKWGYFQKFESKIQIFESSPIF